MEAEDSESEETYTHLLNQLLTGKLNLEQLSDWICHSFQLNKHDLHFPAQEVADKPEDKALPVPINAHGDLLVPGGIIIAQPLRFFYTVLNFVREEARNVLTSGDNRSTTQTPQKRIATTPVEQQRKALVTQEEGFDDIRNFHSKTSFKKTNESVFSHNPSARKKGNRKGANANPGGANRLAVGVVDDAAFPSLQSAIATGKSNKSSSFSGNTKGFKKGQNVTKPTQQKREKRRISTTLVSEEVKQQEAKNHTNSMWNVAEESRPFGDAKPAAPPVEEALERRLTSNVLTPQKKRSTSIVEAPTTPVDRPTRSFLKEFTPVSGRKVEPRTAIGHMSSPKATEVTSSPFSNRKGEFLISGQTENEDKGLTGTLSEEGRRLSRLYSFIIINRFTPAVTGELLLLARMLNITKSCDVKESAPGLFSGRQATIFARQALHYLFQANFYFNGPSLHALLRHHAVKGCSELLAIVARRSQLISDSWAAQSATPAGVTVGENGEEMIVIGGALNEKSSESLLPLPFRPEIDSRNHYTLPEHARLYSNRERTRDSFLLFIREFQDAKYSVNTREWDQFHAKFPEKAKCLLKDTFSTNFRWLAQLFVSELLNVGTSKSRESENELLESRRTARSLNPEKLKQLQRRISMQDSKSVSATAPINVDGGSSSVSSNDVVGHLFPDNQEFFYLFVTSCDSYVFVSLLRDVLAANHREISENVYSHLEGNLAFELATEDAVQNAKDRPFALNLYEHLKQAVQQKHLVFTLAWFIDFLQMMKNDKIIQKTMDYRTFVQALILVYRERRRRPPLHEVTEKDAEPLQASKLLSIQHSNCVSQILLEMIFGELNENPWKAVVTEPKALQLSSPLQEESEAVTIPLDEDMFLVGKKYWQICCPQFYEFQSALRTQAPTKLPGTAATPTTLRKLKPHSISLQTSQEELRSENTSEDTGDDPSLQKVRQTLISHFLQQNPAIRQLVEVITGLMVKSASAYALDACVPQAVEASTVLFQQSYKPGQSVPWQDISRRTAFIKATVSKVQQKASPAAVQRAKKFCEIQVEKAVDSLHYWAGRKDPMRQATIPIILSTIEAQLPLVLIPQVRSAVKENVEKRLKTLIKAALEREKSVTVDESKSDTKGTSQPPASPVPTREKEEETEEDVSRKLCFDFMASSTSPKSSREKGKERRSTSKGKRQNFKGDSPLESDEKFAEELSEESRKLSLSVEYSREQLRLQFKALQRYLEQSASNISHRKEVATTLSAIVNDVFESHLSASEKIDPLLRQIAATSAELIEKKLVTSFVVERVLLSRLLPLLSAQSTEQKELFRQRKAGYERLHVLGEEVCARYTKRESGIEFVALQNAVQLVKTKYFLYDVIS